MSSHLHLVLYNRCIPTRVLETSQCKHIEITLFLYYICFGTFIPFSMSADLVYEIEGETLEVVSLFKNALCYTLAFTTVQGIEQNEADLVLVAISVCVCVFGVTLLKGKLKSLLHSKTLPELFIGPFECVLFLVRI